VTTSTDFLYPFIDGDESDLHGLLDDLARSAREKARESVRLRVETRANNTEALTSAAQAMAQSFRAGGRLHTFGNGGSATDAAQAAERFRASCDGGGGLAALCLVDEPAVVSALANDIGFDVVFARQLEALAQPGDIALGISTSGGSVNVARAFAQARRRDLVTVAIVGYGGGALAADDAVQHCLVVQSQSVHRIQESQHALVGDLHRSVRNALSAEARS
jgi:D-sedoheptulose 7-phosphate isomerase